MTGPIEETRCAAESLRFYTPTDGPPSIRVYIDPYPKPDSRRYAEWAVDQDTMTDLVTWLADGRVLRDGKCAWDDRPTFQVPGRILHDGMIWRVFHRFTRLWFVSRPCPGVSAKAVISRGSFGYSVELVHADFLRLTALQMQLVPPEPAPAEEEEEER